jgi:hypothetical protein
MVSCVVSDGRGQYVRSLYIGVLEGGGSWLGYMLGQTIPVRDGQSGLRKLVQLW